jgi:hypothetical protein
MALYRVTQIRIEPCPQEPTMRHITDALLDGADGSHRVGVSVVRLMLSAGDNLVAQSTVDGEPADVRKSRCVCGYKTIRTLNGSRADDDMGGVPVFS